jgi:hypothetical protein
MPCVRVPNEFEEQIIRENGMDPSRYGVCYKDADMIRLICYATRDTVTIWRGDRKW